MIEVGPFRTSRSTTKHIAIQRTNKMILSHKIIFQHPRVSTTDRYKECILDTSAGLTKDRQTVIVR